MSKELPPTTPDGLTLALETMAALRQNLFDAMVPFYDDPDDDLFMDILNAQTVMADHFEHSLANIYYDPDYSTGQKLDMVQSLQVEETRARVNFLNGLIGIYNDHPFEEAEIDYQEKYADELSYLEITDIDVSQLSLHDAQAYSAYMDQDIYGLYWRTIYRFTSNS